MVLWSCALVGFSCNITFIFIKILRSDAGWGEAEEGSLLRGTDDISEMLSLSALADEAAVHYWVWERGSSYTVGFLCVCVQETKMTTIILSLSANLCNKIRLGLLLFLDLCSAEIDGLATYTVWMASLCCLVFLWRTLVWLFSFYFTDKTSFQVCLL